MANKRTVYFTQPHGVVSEFKAELVREYGDRVLVRHKKKTLMVPRSQVVRIEEPETPAERAKRLERNKKARARHFRKTGVSEKTLGWLDEHGML
jgi:hypothetical protein